MILSQKEIKKFGAMYSIYYIFRSIATKVDSTYLDLTQLSKHLGNYATYLKIWGCVQYMTTAGQNMTHCHVMFVIYLI